MKVKKRPKHEEDEKDSWDDYKPSKAQIDERANQRGGEFDSVVKDRYANFSPKGGTKYKIRVLPPTWPNPRHYGYDAWVHYNVGAENQSYLCLEKHGKGTCPVCREIRKDPELGKGEGSMKAKRRVTMWIIDRDHEDDGPKVWLCPWTLDRDISGRSQNEDTQQALSIANPNEGYDVKFKREGEKLQTKYEQVEIVRSSTPLSDDDETIAKWRKFVKAHPLPDVLDFRDPAYIDKILTGEDEEEPDADDEAETAEEDDDEEQVETRKGKKKRKPAEDEDDELDAPDEDEESDEDEEDEDERPAKKPLKGKDREKFLRGKVEDDDEEEEEEKPRKKKSTKELRGDIKKKLKNRKRDDE